MIKVYTGPMYAAKSLGLIQAAKVRQKQGINNVVCFKPSKDTRDMSKIKSTNPTVNIINLMIVVK